MLCPLLIISTQGNEATSECKETKCAWWVKYLSGEGGCAITEIAKELADANKNKSS